MFTTVIGYLFFAVCAFTLLACLLTIASMVKHRKSWRVDFTRECFTLKDPDNNGKNLCELEFMPTLVLHGSYSPAELLIDMRGGQA